MASKRKPSNTKPYPVQRCIPLTGNVQPMFTAILKGPQALSQVNYRLMRETRMYRMKVDLQNSISGGVKVYALRNDWGLRGAISMAHRMWKLATKEERKIGGLSKWYDFRIDYGVGENVTPAPHVTPLRPMLNTVTTSTVAGVGYTQLPATTIASGEFGLSTVVSEDTGLVKTFSLKPSPLTSMWGILHEFSHRGNAADDATPETDTPYAGLVATADPAAALHLQSTGDEPPYDGDEFANTSPWVHVATLRSASSGRSMSTGFMDVPCGVLLFTNEDYSTPLQVEDHDLCVEFQSGDYKGVKSWPLV